MQQKIHCGSLFNSLNQPTDWHRVGLRFSLHRLNLDFGHYSTLRGKGGRMNISKFCWHIWCCWPARRANGGSSWKNLNLSLWPLNPRECYDTKKSNVIPIPILAANNIGILIPILFLPILPIQLRYFFRYFCKLLLLGLGKHLNSKWRDGNSKPQNLDPPWTGCYFAKIREGHQDKGSAVGAKISKKADVKKF